MNANKLRSDTAKSEKPKIVAIMPCRNEDWIIGLSARALLTWVDQLIVLDHGSTDRTADILRYLQLDYGCERLLILPNNDSQWQEMEHRQTLLKAARLCGGTHIVTVDADEVLTGNLLPDIRGIVERMPTAGILQLPWICLRGGIDKMHYHGIWGGASVASTAFVDSPACHWASAERGGYQHHHRHPMGKPFISWWPVGRQDGGLFHLQFVDDRRLRAKQFWYCLQERLRWPHMKTPQQVVDYYSPAVYGHAKNEKPAELATVPAAWWEPYSHLLQCLHVGGEPWQLAEIRRIVRDNPGIEAGLDDFGVLEF